MGSPTIRLRCCWPECAHEWDGTYTASDYTSCPRCHASFSFRKPITLTPTPPAPAVRHWQHDETGRVCDCVDCPGPRYHEVNEAFAEAHEKAMREKRGTPAPADDASGAEAMRAAFVAHMATVGVTDVAWTNALGPVGTRADHYGVMLSVEWERFAAGYRAALTASDGAVEEAAERDSFCAYLSAQKPPIKPRWNAAKRRWEYRDGRPYPYCETAWRFWMARAALRREKGGA